MQDTLYYVSLILIAVNVLWAAIMIPVNFYGLCRVRNVAKWLADSAYEKLFRLHMHIFTILLCTTLYIHLEPTELSTMLTVLTLGVYGSLEYYAVRYFMNAPETEDPII
ncbi:MAG: hypothetical protein KF762_04890 [Acidobacteria bacterium]|nr:hypothetical protein [Acidobacteriota bacterium]